MTLRQKTVGIYCIGSEQVQIVLREGTGGDFYTVPERGGVPRIKIGADYGNWGSVLSALIHEATEFMMVRARCRFDPADDLGRDHSAYVFVMNHPQFSDTCARVADLLANCLPDVSREWKKWNAAKK